jgi:hypothetical protein
MKSHFSHPNCIACFWPVIGGGMEGWSGSDDDKGDGEEVDEVVIGWLPVTI